MDKTQQSPNVPVIINANYIQQIEVSAYSTSIIAMLCFLYLGRSPLTLTYKVQFKYIFIDCFIICLSKKYLINKIWLKKIDQLLLYMTNCMCIKVKWHSALSPFFLLSWLWTSQSSCGFC